jgi:hypothetical protein
MFLDPTSFPAFQLSSFLNELSVGALVKKYLCLAGHGQWIEHAEDHSGH